MKVSLGIGGAWGEQSTTELLLSLWLCPSRLSPHLWHPNLHPQPLHTTRRSGLGHLVRSPALPIRSFGQVRRRRRSAFELSSYPFRFFILSSRLLPNSHLDPSIFLNPKPQSVRVQNYWSSLTPPYNWPLSCCQRQVRGCLCALCQWNHDSSPRRSHAGS